MFVTVIVFGFLWVAKSTIEAERMQAVVPVRQDSSQENTDRKEQGAMYDGAHVKAVIGTTSVRAEIAQSDGKKALGLGNREALEKGTGMLFVFDEPSAYRFWNRDMRFPIDMLWILNDRVVDLYEHLPTYAAEKDFTVTPQAPANFILEVPDGFIKENTIHIGDTIIYESEEN